MPRTSAAAGANHALLIGEKRVFLGDELVGEQ
jgi:hypothetical protein